MRLQWRRVLRFCELFCYPKPIRLILPCFWKLYGVLGVDKFCNNHKPENTPLAHLFKTGIHDLFYCWQNASFTNYKMNLFWSLWNDSSICIILILTIYYYNLCKSKVVTEGFENWKFREISNCNSGGFTLGQNRQSCSNVHKVYFSSTLRLCIISLFILGKIQRKRF